MEGFQVHRTRGDHSGFFQAEIDGQLKGKVFYWCVRVRVEGSREGEVRTQGLVGGVHSCMHTS